MFSSTHAQGADTSAASGEVSASFLGVAPIVEPAQFNEAFIGDFARHVVERIAQEMHIVRQRGLPDRIRFGNYFGDPTLKSRMIVADREEDAA